MKTEFAPAIQGEIDGVRALTPPPADRALVRQIVDLAQADLNRVKRNPALIAGPTDAFADVARIAHPYGLKACDPSP